MVKRRPKNILQELKSLVSKFSGHSGSSAKDTASGKGKGPPLINIKGKRKGKDKGQGQGTVPSNSNEQTERVQVVKGKPKAHDNPAKPGSQAWR